MITVAADSGVSHARELGLPVDVLVGDFDSADRASVRWAEGQGAEIAVHPSSKDETDLELALERAVQLMADRSLRELVVVGLGGGRLDHWLANLLALGGSRTQGVDVTAYVDSGRISVVRRWRRLAGRAGELVSLIPIGGPARAVTTTGLAYPLTAEDLEAGRSRGVSNIFAPEHADSNGMVAAEVTIESGTLLAVQPEFLTPNLLVDHGGSEGPEPAPGRP